MSEPPPRARLAREIGLPGLIATALCAMLGVGNNIIPFMVQRSQPGIGDSVPLAYLAAAVPAALAALCYAIFASAMPRAGGSYVYATRALDPFAGFLGSFAQWFGLSMGMGVVAYLTAPMLRDIAITAGWPSAAAILDGGLARVPLALAAIWIFWWINLQGVRTYERTIIVMAAAMIAGPLIMTIVGFASSPSEFERALAARGIAPPPDAPLPGFSWKAFFGASVLLFSSFIGFDAVSQAGGEARRPVRDIPRAIVAAIAVATVFYVAFTASVYHAVPWDYILRVSLVRDSSAPALLAPLMPPWLAIVMLVAVTVALLDSIPSVMLANSRMLYAFGADRVFPAALARVHPRHRTPHHALTLTAAFGSLSVLGCHLAGDFFLGVDILVLSMLVSFLLIAAAILTFPHVNPRLYRDVSFLRRRPTQVRLALASIALLGTLLAAQVANDLARPGPWYGRSTIAWLAVMGAAALIFGRFWRLLRRQGIDPRAEIFSALPAE